MEAALKRVLDQYRTSQDFNGLHFRDVSTVAKEEVVALVAQGLVQVVSEEDYPNPHIRPWPSRRSVAQQIESVRQIDEDSLDVCLYPTPLALSRHRTRKTYPNEPYRAAMAKGRGTLELAYFSFEVLEQYRNDPRFQFKFSDFGAEVVIADEHYLDADEPEHDKIVMSHIGFAYDLSDYSRDDPESPIIRRVCAFYGDLAKLSDIHQQRWKTYEVAETGLSPHPMWWAQQMGHWPDGLGPFERFFFELEALNELNASICGEPLFRSTDRPDDFGWILRASQREWDQFIHQLDKLLSENLNSKALNALGAPRENVDGQPLGSLNRLAELLKQRKVPTDAMMAVMKPLRSIRQARQGPAHAIRANLSDKTYIHKQVALLEDVTSSLDSLRRFWHSHPGAQNWQEPDYIRDGQMYRM